MITTLVIAGLAVWQVIKIWEYSELFAGPRARAQASNGFFGRLLQCAFCMSNWVAAFIVCTLAASEVLTRLESHFDTPWLPVASMLLAIPAQIFAVARAANLANDFFKIWDRTPKYHTEIAALSEESDDTGESETAYED